MPPLAITGGIADQMGAIILAYGILAALIARDKHGVGQEVDISHLGSMTALQGLNVSCMAMLGKEFRRMPRVAAPSALWNHYQCADGKWIAVGAIEPQFYAAFLEVLGLGAATLPDRDDPATWATLKERFAAVFKTRTRDEWSALAEGRDACLAPVLTPGEAPEHPHNRARRTFLDLDGVPQPAPAPRFSRSASAPPVPPVHPGAATAETLADWGFGADEVAKLVESGVLV